MKTVTGIGHGEDEEECSGGGARAARRAQGRADRPLICNYGIKPIETISVEEIEPIPEG